MLEKWLGIKQLRDKIDEDYVRLTNMNAWLEERLKDLELRVDSIEKITGVPES